MTLTCKNLFFYVKRCIYIYLSFRDPTDDLFPAGHQCPHHDWVGHHAEEKQIRKTLLHTRIITAVKTRAALCHAKGRTCFSSNQGIQSAKTRSLFLLSRKLPETPCGGEKGFVFLMSTVYNCCIFQEEFLLLVFCQRGSDSKRKLKRQHITQEHKVTFSHGLLHYAGCFDWEVTWILWRGAWGCRSNKPRRGSGYTRRLHPARTKVITESTVKSKTGLEQGFLQTCAPFFFFLTVFTVSCLLPQVIETGWKQRGLQT